MKKFFAAILICFLILLSQTPVITELYDNKNISLYESEISKEVFADYSYSITEDEIPVKMFGMTVKKINVKEDKKVYLGGQTVGIAMYTNGLLVTDIISIENQKGSVITPAQDAGIKKGDYIMKANGIKMDDVSNIDAILKASNGEKIKLTILRNDKTFNTEITPVKSKKDGAYRLGMWMRDSAAGLGTITYINPSDNTFMALGHSICDADTGNILSLSSGRLVECVITGVKKGTKGSAGELKGTFGVNARQLGNITENTKFGLVGINTNLNKGKLIQLGSKETIKEGKAYIYSDFETGELKQYEIEIVHINDQTYPCEKSMVIKITDKNLINKTGGIVQGLSGSPIVQDDKLIGAVTHVMVNDSTRGYGIFIENMIYMTEKENKAA